MTKTALKILGIDKAGEASPGTLIGNNNVLAGNEMVAASKSTKLTGNLIPALFGDDSLRGGSLYPITAKKIGYMRNDATES